MSLTCAFSCQWNSYANIVKKKKNQGSTLCGQLLLLRSLSGPRVSVLDSKQKSATGRDLAAVLIAEEPVIAGSPQDESWLYP